jgi:hypothetical protein
MLIRRPSTYTSDTFKIRMRDGGAVDFPQIATDGGADDLKVRCDPGVEALIGTTINTWHQFNLTWVEASSTASWTLDGVAGPGCTAAAAGADIDQVQIRSTGDGGDGMMFDNIIVTDGACP